MAQAQQVNGTANIGDKVRYFDMANQNGEVWEVLSTPEQNEDPTWGWSKGYGLRSEHGEEAFSDLAQHGWTFTN